MTSHGCIITRVALCLLWLAPTTRLSAESGDPTAAASPIQDDANLHDIHFVGTHNGWVVGDHGSIWHTRDGGGSWRFQQSGVDCSLNSVCFLTNSIGWVVGGGTRPYTQRGFGVVLHTIDGGTTWTQVSRTELPRLHAVRFFGPATGMAVGDRGAGFPTGIMQTSDGGQTWRPVVGDIVGGWRSAEFRRLGLGVVAGSRGRLAVVGAGRLLPPRFDRPSLRTFRDLALRDDDSGWAVGDGSLLLTTHSGGVTWQPPPTPFPKPIAGIFDGRAVSVAGQQVWIGGSPGSVIWHSADQGQTWNALPTRQSLPINDLEFVSTQEGWAAGDLGTILHTRDAGRSWQPVLGEARRAALLVITSRPQRLSLHLITRQSADLGYRSVVWLPAGGSRHSPPQDGTNLDIRLKDAVLAAAGSAAEVDWRLPVDVPGIAHQRDRLLANWNERHEGRLAEVLVGMVVAKLRTWRPSVVVIDQPARDDAVAQILQQAVVRAVPLAADPAAFPEQLRLAGLQPWQTTRILQRLPPGDRGHEQIDPGRFLPRLGTSLQAAATPAYARLTAEVPDGPEAYAAVAENTDQTESASGFFTGLSIVPGSDARRHLLPYDDPDQDQRRRAERRQRNLRAIARQLSGNATAASRFVANLDQITRGLPPHEAAQQLAFLAAQERRAARWQLAEEISLELVNRFPDRPEAINAMHWLFQLWSSAEANWQRAKQQRIQQQRVVPVSASGTAFRPDAAKSAAAEASTRPRQAGRRDLVAGWNQRAARIAESLRDHDSALFRSADFQFSLAALHRQSSDHRLADGIYRSFLTAPKSDHWKQAAEQELWLIRPTGFAPTDHSLCSSANRPPQLDGTLSEACWQRAQPIRLTADAGDELADEPQPMVLLSHDDRFLYIGLSVPRVAGTSTAAPELSGRTHDADLTLYDRVAIQLDVDRDRSICYDMHIDQRGWTAESAWGERSWNPRYWVAASSDTRRWRIEAAIPFSELVARPPTAGSVWCLRITRIAPAIGMQSFPAAQPRTPQRYGLLEFR